MSKTIFDDKTFDPAIFASYPKCQGTYNGKDGSGCILTAFWAGFGFSCSYGIALLEHETDRLAWSLLGIEDFVKQIIYNYDEDDSLRGYKGTIGRSVDLIWQLIEKLPNKVSREISKEQVVLPVCEVSK